MYQVRRKPFPDLRDWSWRMYFCSFSFSCSFTHRLPGLLNIEWVTNRLTSEIKSVLRYTRIHVIIRESGVLERLSHGYSGLGGSSIEFPTEYLPNTSLMHQIFLIFCYLATLSISRLYGVDDRVINENGTVCDMRIGRGNRSTLRKPAPLSLHPSQILHDLSWPRM
jgi:hypothetical protein